MLQQWLIEFGTGMGKLFLHPLFYYSFVLSLVFGYIRVKRERSEFHVRAQNGYFELKQLFASTWLIGLIISVVTVVLGISIPYAAVLVVGVFTMLVSLTLRLRLLSPGYTLGVTFFILFFLFEKDVQLPGFVQAFSDLETNIYPSLPLLMGLLLLAEGFLIKRNAYKATSPKLITSKRGLPVGAHVSRRVWMIPFFVFIPGGELPSPFAWWPVFDLPGDGSITPVLLPFLIGFSQTVKGMLPKESISLNGSRVLVLGFVVTVISVIGFWYPMISIVAAAIGLLGRESVTFFQRLFEEKLPFYFSQRSRGVMILGIIPDSPAEKMGLEIGEIVTKVNGTVVYNQTQFYEALSPNRAHCKLEVLDSQDQIRFVQRALYEGEHHELGILFVQNQKKMKQEAV
ncbi:PDZ domain-containing protein [Peribacillus acanthi]|uniref:PDZ domain-containing protein n=1 Tax=Peribacillus acanthi TaxID=2171554 RepID=UPI00196AE529|nr:PDZ domain-containing protein [Peribacillus acanthi]